MTVVSDSSPLITLARIGCLDRLPKLYRHVLVSKEVYREVVISGAGLPGAEQVAKAEWIEVIAIREAEEVAQGIMQTGLGAGEVSAVICVGILEILYRRSEIADLRDAYVRLLGSKFRVDLTILQRSLEKFKLPSL